jgi:hypothetical protein
MRRAIVFAPVLLILGVLVVAVLFTLFDSREKQASDDWDRQVNAAVRQLATDYTLPVTEASPQTVICKRVRPGDNVPECANYVEAVSRHAESVVSIKERLSYLAENAPGSVSAEHREDARQMAHALTIMAEANDLLVSGWAESDRTKWEESWRRFEAAAIAMGQVYE